MPLPQAALIVVKLTRVRSLLDAGKHVEARELVQEVNALLRESSKKRALAGGVSWR